MIVGDSPFSLAFDSPFSLSSWNPLPDAEVSLWFFPLFRRDLGICGKSLDVYGLEGLECQGGGNRGNPALVILRN